MTDGVKRYELLALLPLTGTEEALKRAADQIEERLKAAGAIMGKSATIFKGRLAYPIPPAHNGCYYLLQFELDPRALAEFRRNLLLSRETLRFTISSVPGAFKTFVPSPPKIAPVRAARMPRATAPFGYSSPALPRAVAAGPSPRVKEAVQPNAVPKVSLEEIDKRLEEILGA